MKSGGVFDLAREDAQIAGFDRIGLEQARAEVEQHAVVEARVLVLDRGHVGRAHRAARRVEQALVQGALAGPGLLHRPDLGAQQVGAQEIVGDAQPPGSVALEQVKSGVAPEVLGHCARSRRAPRYASAWTRSNTRLWDATCWSRNSI